MHRGRTASDPLNPEGGHQRPTETGRNHNNDDPLAEDDVVNMTLLPHEFVPSEHDVIVGTGRLPKIHVGNIRFHERIHQLYAKRYAKAKTRLDKSMIISEIVVAVREKSPSNTGFVKRVGTRWYTLNDRFSRERVSQSLRNILQDQYRSSTKAKKRRRSQICTQIDYSISQMVQTKGSSLSNQVKKLSTAVKEQRRSGISDEEVVAAFTKANTDILEGLKQDATLQAMVLEESAVTALDFVDEDESDLKKSGEDDRRLLEIDQDWKPFHVVTTQQEEYGHPQPRTTTDNTAPAVLSTKFLYTSLVGVSSPDHLDITEYHSMYPWSYNE